MDWFSSKPSNPEEETASDSATSSDSAASSLLQRDAGGVLVQRQGLLQNFDIANGKGQALPPFTLQFKVLHGKEGLLDGDENRRVHEFVNSQQREENRLERKLDR